MHALDVEGELLACDRPTIPVPEARESGVRMAVERVACGAATIDVVTCDLTRDPRSEDYVPGARRRVMRSGRFPKRCIAPVPYGANVVVPKEEPPPSTSFIRGIK